MKKQPIVLIGGGGHCHSCIDVIEMQDAYQIEGILDNGKKVGEYVMGYPVLGPHSEENIKAWHQKACHFLITIGHMGAPEIRMSLYKLMFQYDIKLASPISPRAYVSKHAQVGHGTIVMHDVVINAGARVGDNCIINTKSLIEHDAQVGDHVHISTAAVINGNVCVEDGVFFGSHATTKQGITVPAGTFVKAGSMVKESVIRTSNNEKSVI